MSEFGQGVKQKNEDSPEEDDGAIKKLKQQQQQQGDEYVEVVLDDEEEEESQVSQRIGLSRAHSLHQWHPTWSHLIWEAVG